MLASLHSLAYDDYLLVLSAEVDVQEFGNVVHIDVLQQHRIFIEHLQFPCIEDSHVLGKEDLRQVFRSEFDLILGQVYCVSLKNVMSQRVRSSSDDLVSLCL